MCSSFVYIVSDDEGIIDVYDLQIDADEKAEHMVEVGYHRVKVEKWTIRE